MPKHTVFYHGADLDGKACAAIYNSKRLNVSFYPVDYGQKFPSDKVAKNDIVAILDFCPDDMNVIQEIMETVPVFYWFDHHPTSRRMYEKNHFKDIHTPPGLYVTDSEEKPMAACELLYMYLYDCDYEDIPYYIRLLGRFDVWDFTDRQTLPFQYAMKAWLGDPIKDFQQWKKLLNPSKADHQLFQKLIEAGKYIKMYEDKKNAEVAKTICFEMEFEGYKTLAVNRTLESSKFFDAVYNPKKHDLLLQFGFHGDFWKLSFRATKANVDCAKLAEKYNGGGHKLASSCVLKALPDIIKERIF
jgi:uncharacterized protein